MVADLSIVTLAIVVFGLVADLLFQYSWSRTGGFRGLDFCACNRVLDVF